jgi:hypothetical protein
MDLMMCYFSTFISIGAIDWFRLGVQDSGC